jgi:hypothetical protein
MSGFIHTRYGRSSCFGFSVRLNAHRTHRRGGKVEIWSFRRDFQGRVGDGENLLLVFAGLQVGLCRPKQEIHVILDNLSAHKTQKVARFLQEHPNLELHFTPTIHPG